METASAFIHRPDPQHPGWHTWDLVDDGRFNSVAMGKFIVRREGERAARLRMPEVEARHGNLMDGVHGGMILALIDIALFAGVYKVLEIDPSGAVTVDVSCQFVGAGALGTPLDAVVEVMKETGRLVFLRGTVEQEHGLVAGFQATVRKPGRR